MGGASTKNFWSPKDWTTKGTMLSPNVPTPKAPPAPPDTVKAMLREYNKAALDRKLRAGSGRAGLMAAAEPYRAPGSKSLLGG